MKQICDCNHKVRHCKDLVWFQSYIKPNLCGCFCLSVFISLTTLIGCFSKIVKELAFCSRAQKLSAESCTELKVHSTKMSTGSIINATGQNVHPSGLAGGRL